VNLAWEHLPGNLAWKPFPGILVLVTLLGNPYLWTCSWGPCC
jgi:hypothetical protein